MEIEEATERETGEPAPASGSLMDRLRAQHRALAESDTLTIDIPGYEGVLAAKYRVLDVKSDLNAISRKVGKEFKDPMLAQLYGSIDIMARACVELLAYVGEEKLPLAEARDGDGALLFGVDAPPVRYDTRFAEFMGFLDVTTARECVMALFAGNEPMAMEHAQALSRWMSNTTLVQNETFLGNL